MGNKYKQYRQLFEYIVLVFRDQDFEIDTFEVFAQYLGPFGYTPFITPVEGVTRTRRRRAAIWQRMAQRSEFSNRASKRHSPLCGRGSRRGGGDTAYTNQYLACETLSDSMQKLLDGLNAVHRAERSYGPGGTFGRPDPDSSTNICGDESAVVHQAHPLVRTHPVTGRKALYANEVYTVAIENMTSAESSALLKFLFERSRQIGFTCRVRWRPGTLTMWDNRVTRHFAINDCLGSRREMYRITVAGEKPR